MALEYRLLSFDQKKGKWEKGAKLHVEAEH